MSDPSIPDDPDKPNPALADFIGAIKRLTNPSVPGDPMLPVTLADLQAIADDYEALERLRTRGYLPENPARPPLKRPMDSLSSLNFDPSEGSE